MSELSIELPAVPDSIPRARAALETLRGTIDEDRLEDLRLLVSEVVTNSVRHAGLGEDDAIDISVGARGDRIRVEITDPGPGFAADARPLTIYQESGWGLYLVSQLAERWGVTTRGSRTTVWLELAR